MAGRSILVVGDPHAKPGVTNRRFDWLGAYIADTKPDIVVQMGDLFDMESLSSYDKGRKSFEGRRYKRDLEAGIDALDRINRKLKGLRKKPRLISLIGNHEHRIDRACEENPELDGTLSLKDLQLAEHGHEVAQFLEAIDVCGINFSHYFTSGVMGRPIGGENVAVTLLKTQFKSSCQGHNHLLSMAGRTRGDGQKMQGWTAGWFGDPDQFEKYAGPANKLWTKCLLHLEDVENGYTPSYRVVGIDTLRRNYG